MEGLKEGTRRFQNETDSGFAALLGIGLPEGSGDLHAGITKSALACP
jgi:hypothetical protein